MGSGIGGMVEDVLRWFWCGGADEQTGSNTDGINQQDVKGQTDMAEVAWLLIEYLARTTNRLSRKPRWICMMKQ